MSDKKTIIERLAKYDLAAEVAKLQFNDSPEKVNSFHESFGISEECIAIVKEHMGNKKEGVIGVNSDDIGDDLFVEMALLSTGMLLLSDELLARILVTASTKNPTAYDDISTYADENNRYASQVILHIMKQLSKECLEVAALAATSYAWSQRLAVTAMMERMKASFSSGTSKELAEAADEE